MNYKKSQDILAEINKANKILINLHRGPDPDSLSSAFSLYYFLCSLGKEIDVVLTSKSEMSSQISKFEESNLVKFVDFARFKFDKYDLFISPDSGSWQQIVDDVNVKIPEIPIILIDHHESNDKFGKINLVDSKAASCAQIIYLLFKDWEFFIDTKMANLLMTGIVSDTGGFAFTNDANVMTIAGELMKLGADKEKIINDMFRTQPFKQVKAWGEFLSRMNLDKNNKFVWTALSYKDYKNLKIPPKASSIVATLYGNIIEECNFGIVMSEDEKGMLKVSLRSRSDIDVSKLGELLGGGGHKKAAGGIIKGMPFEKAVEKVLETARKYAKEN